MSTVYYELNKNNKLSSKQITMLEKMDKQPITYDEDCPELTDNQIARIREQRNNQKYLAKKKNISIRLSNKTIDTAKKLGKGYTNLIAEIVETTFADDNLLKKYIR